MKEISQLDSLEWTRNAQLEYCERLREGIATVSPRKSSQNEFLFSKLDSIYSLRILSNSQIKEIRNKEVQELLESEEWKRLLTSFDSPQPTNSQNGTISQLADSAPKWNLETALLVGKKIYLSNKNKMIFRIAKRVLSKNIVRQCYISLTEKKSNFEIRLISDWPVFTKLQIVTIVEILIEISEISKVQLLLQKCKELFSSEPDVKWWEQLRTLCEFENLSKYERPVRNCSGFFVSQILHPQLDSDRSEYFSRSYLPRENKLLRFNNTIEIVEKSEPQIVETLLITKQSLIVTPNEKIHMQGEFYSQDDFYLGPLNQALVPVNKLGLVLMRREECITLENTNPPFLLSAGNSTNYWHAMIEALPRLASIDDTQNLLWLGELPSNIRKIIAILNPSAEIIHVKDSGVKIKSIKTSPLTCISHEPFWESKIPKFTAETLLKYRDKLNNCLDKKMLTDRKFKSKKYFLLRESSHRINQVRELAQSFEKFGYQVVTPSRMSFEDQVNTFANAEILVGEVGALWANLIFCKPGTRIYSLAALPSAPTTLFSGFSEILNLNFTAIIFPDNWYIDTNNHWQNTSEAYFQTGFQMNSNDINNTFEFVMEDIRN